jgi:hypothetical protein
MKVRSLVMLHEDFAILAGRRSAAPAETILVLLGAHLDRLSGRQSSIELLPHLSSKAVGHDFRLNLLLQSELLELFGSECLAIGNLLFENDVIAVEVGLVGGLVGNGAEAGDVVVELLKLSGGGDTGLSWKKVW